MDEDKSAPHCVENVLYFSGVTPEKLYRRNGTSQSMALVFETVHGVEFSYTESRLTTMLHLSKKISLMEQVKTFEAVATDCDDKTGLRCRCSTVATNLV